MNFRQQSTESFSKSKGLNHAGDTTYTNTKLPKQHHDKKTDNVKTYQYTKIDTKRHITDKK